MNYIDGYKIRTLKNDLIIYRLTFVLQQNSLRQSTFIIYFSVLRIRKEAQQKGSVRTDNDIGSSQIFSESLLFNYDIFHLFSQITESYDRVVVRPGQK